MFPSFFPPFKTTLGEYYFWVCAEEVGQQRAWDHGPNFVLRHLTVEVEEIGAPMDAIFDNESTNAELFKKKYLHIKPLR